MPKIFALRHQLAEQQARLKQQAKFNTDVIEDNGGGGGGSSAAAAAAAAAAQTPPVLPHRASFNQPLDLGRQQQGKMMKKHHSKMHGARLILQIALKDCIH